MLLFAKNIHDPGTSSNIAAQLGKALASLHSDKYGSGHAAAMREAATGVMMPESLE